MEKLTRRGIALETTRLFIFPLERKEHLLLLEAIRALEKFPGLLPGRDDFPPGFYDAMRWLYNRGEGRLTAIGSPTGRSQPKRVRTVSAGPVRVRIP